MHRDVKPANILLNEKWQVKMTDFGTAKCIASDKGSSLSAVSDASYISGLSNISALSGLDGKSKNSKSSFEANDDELVGSELYISPEMVENRSYSYASDLWAVGVMLYQFLVG